MAAVVPYIEVGPDEREAAAVAAGEIPAPKKKA